MDGKWQITLKKKNTGVLLEYRFSTGGTSPPRVV
jgi:hypothetical protein